MNSFSYLLEEPQKRLDTFLAGENELTRSAIKKLIEDGHVFVNGEIVTKAGRELKIGDTVLLEIPDSEPLSIRPEDIPIDIVYQDSDLAVVNKPQGMTVHMGAGNADGTLVNALLFHLDSLSGINGVIRPGIVHRIDKDTSGLLVVAKNDRAHLSLSKQIAEKTCHRVYFALLEGEVKEDRGRITTYIGRSPVDRIKMAVVPEGKGKLAITDFEVEKKFQGYTLMKFTLQTGRTHQIRVHAKYMGHPVVGDPVYGYKNQKFKLKGQLLHAAELTLVHPTTGETMTFHAPLPNYFTEVLEKLK
ncbi:MAG: RluA family pseudouridine synthase [Clostridia bacterium]|nr:RluA family pseudouridine synthase [Clostridia bacterium]